MWSFSSRLFPAFFVRYEADPQLRVSEVKVSGLRKDVKSEIFMEEKRKVNTFEG